MGLVVSYWDLTLIVPRENYYFVLTNHNIDDDSKAKNSKTNANVNWFVICKLVTIVVIRPPIPSDNIQPRDATELVFSGKHLMQPAPALG